MTDLLPPSVPTPDDRWVAERRRHLMAELATTPATSRPAAWSRPGGSALQRRRPLVWAASGTGVAAAASVATVVGLAGTGSPAAFAGWSPRPTPPATGQLTAAVASCAAAEPAGSGQVVLEDTRGPFTMVMRADGDTGTACITGPDGTDQSIEAWLGTSPADGGAELIGSVSTLDGQPVALAMGHVGSGVTAVTVTLQDGTPIVASVAGGWFGAWWPTGEHASAVAVTSGTGTTTCAVTALPKLPRPGATPGSGSPSSSASSSSASSSSASAGSASAGTAGGPGHAGPTGGDHAPVHPSNFWISVRARGSASGSAAGMRANPVTGFLARCPAG